MFFQLLCGKLQVEYGIGPQLACRGYGLGRLEVPPPPVRQRPGGPDEIVAQPDSEVLAPPVDHLNGFAANKDHHLHSGDFVYYDKPSRPRSTTIEKARHKWHRISALPSLVDFYKQVPAYLTKDDHDTLCNDSHPYIEPYGEFSFEDGLSVWRENVPLNDTPYRTYHWGKDLQIWLIEGREYRSDNAMPDSDEKTILGPEQKQWLMKTLKESNATFKIVFSPTPIVGPDAARKADNHANKAFETEGLWLKKLLSQYNVIVINGDRHWQYASVDSETGLQEYGHGPASNSHLAGINKLSKPKFIKRQAGFIVGRIRHDEGKPQLKITFYDVNGVQVYEDYPFL